jgi:broad specificity phosphatase PhoE
MNEQPHVWLIRHGETEWSLSGAHTGRTDIALTERGREAAARVRDFFRGRPFALVLSSPLQRALETCRIAGYGDVVELEPNLQEWDYGVFEGRTTPDIRLSEPEWLIWTASIEKGESLDEVGARADAVIERARRAGGDVLLFAHGHLLRILAARWVGLPPSGGRYLTLGTTGLSILGYERETPVIQMWNQSLETVGV